MVGEAQQVTDDMFRFPFQLAFGAAFGDVGYGVPVGGRPESLAALTAAQVRAWHQRTIGAVRPIVIAVGDIDPHEAAGVLAAVVGDWAPRPARPAVSRLSMVLSDAPIMRSVTRDKAQSAFAMLFPGPARGDSDRHAADVWAAIASGLGGRLFEALRDRRSLAYTVMASAWQRRRAGAILTYIATGPEREAEARAAMLEELDRFVQEPAGAREFERAVEYLAGQLQVARQSASGVASEILDTFLAGESLATLADPAAGVRAVTPAAVQAVAAHAFSGARAEGVIRGSGGGR
jgi:zinc protease